jgi:hypothetical protein
VTTTEARWFQFFLRTIGSASLLAVFAVFLPYETMNATHQWLGMGKLPDAPIVGYLARSTSAFYAILGGLLWLASFDLPRHRLLLGYIGGALAVLGVVLFGVDIIEGLPGYWIAIEGPADTLFGLTIYLWSRRI